MSLDVAESWVRRFSSAMASLGPPPFYLSLLSMDYPRTFAFADLDF